MNRGGGIGAFFDLDGTLMTAPSVERRFIFYLLSSGLIGPQQIARWAARFITNITRNPRDAFGANKTYLSGVSTMCAEEWSRHLALHPMRFFSDGVDRLRFHFTEGHRIFLITGAPAPLAELVASYLSVPLTIVGTRLVARDGLWTGGVAGEHMCGTAKHRAIVRLAAAHGLDLTRSFAYGDSIFDLPMLDTVGHPAAVNPSTKLERAARARNWPTLRWRGRWSGTRNPRVDNSRGAGQTLPALHGNSMQSINCRRAYR